MEVFLKNNFIFFTNKGSQCVSQSFLGEPAVLFFYAGCSCGDENTLYQPSLSLVGDGGNQRIELNI
jgi:hypothetical protein